MAFQKAENICPFCGFTGDFKFKLDADNADGRFSLYECQTCQGQFWSPFSHPGQAWYEQGDTYNVKEEFRPREMHCYHKKFLALNNNLQGVKILDLGCGTGEFLAELKDKGAEVYGVDIDKEAIEISRKFFGFKENVFNSPIKDFFQSQTLPTLDRVTMFEFIEHIDNPAEVLDNIKKVIKAGGKLTISLPSRERLFANLAGWDYPYHHLSRWDGKAFEKFLSAHGFANTKVIYINKFHQLVEVFLEAISKKLNFKKAHGLKNIKIESAEGNEGAVKKIKKIVLKIIYKTGRFIGVSIIPNFLAIIFFPFLWLFFPRSGVMYIETENI